MSRFTPVFAGPAIVAAAALVATPAAAAEFAGRGHASPVTSVAHYGGYYGGGYGGGGYRHRGRSGAGDVLTGVLILGAIAAVASAATRSTQQRRGYPERYPAPNPDYRRYDRADGPRGLEGAADLCMREVERDARVREVTRVERNLGGWLVTGSMADGAGFSCAIGADGRIDRIDVGGSARVIGDGGAVPGPDRQYGDERYRSARAAADAGPQPAYPGGPLPGEDDAPVEDGGTPRG